MTTRHPGSFDWGSLRRRAPLWRPLIAGIVNATPDSFSDGGRYMAPAAAIGHALALLDEGADFLDLGGESTRPGAPEVPPDVEWARIGPVLSGVLRERPATVFSIDTRHAETARRALDAGGAIINDVSGLVFDPEMLALAGACDAGVIAMHSPAPPEVMQQTEHLAGDDPVNEVAAALRRMVDQALGAGVRREALMLDVGIGFGKTRQANYELLRNAAWFEQYFGLPFFWGVSRKSLLKSASDSMEKRVAGSLALAVKLQEMRVSALRVHDVALTLAALQAAAELAGAAGDDANANAAARGSRGGK